MGGTFCELPKPSCFFFLICLYHFRHFFGLIRRNWRNEQRSGIRGAANMNYIL